MQLQQKVQNHGVLFVCMQHSLLARDFIDIFSLAMATEWGNIAIDRDDQSTWFTDDSSPFEYLSKY